MEINHNRMLFQYRILSQSPCNITSNNTIEARPLYEGRRYPFEIICVRYGCGKIKWKKEGYKKGMRKSED